MRFGNTAGTKELEKIAIFKEAGFDYIETDFGAYSKAPAEERREFLKCLDANGFKCEAMNCFIGEKVVGPEFDEKKVKDYLEMAFEICSETDFDVVVFGSGGARKVPDGFPMDEAKKQFRYVCTEFVEPLCVKYGKRVAIENLNRKETNIFNTDAEINEMVNLMGLPHVKLLADNYHMAIENEPYSVLESIGSNLIHAHIANPEGRLFPQPEDSHDYKAFFDAMRKAGYDNRLTVEASAPAGIDLAEASRKTVETLKRFA